VIIFNFEISFLFCIGALVVLYGRMKELIFSNAFIRKTREETRDFTDSAL
jgi:hypothetical protein